MKAARRTNRDEIRRGIDGYGSMQALIGAAILEHGGHLSERDFDAAFGWSRHMEYVPCAITGDTFILTPFGGPQQQYLQLAQYMIRAALISAYTGGDGLVYYTMCGEPPR